MFEDSLIESGGKLKDAAGTHQFDGLFYRGRRYWWASWCCSRCCLPTPCPKQCFCNHHVHVTTASSATSTAPPGCRGGRGEAGSETDIVNGQLRTPTKIPKKVEIIKEDAAPPPVMAGNGGRRSGRWRARRTNGRRNRRNY